MVIMPSVSKMGAEVVNVYDAFLPLEVFLKCLGLLPLFKRTNNYWKQILNWTFIGFTFLFYCISYCILYKYLIAPNHLQWVPLITGYITSSGVFLQPILGITVGVVVKRKFCKIFHTLNCFDEKVFQRILHTSTLRN